MAGTAGEFCHFVISSIGCFCGRKFPRHHRAGNGANPLRRAPQGICVGPDDRSFPLACHRLNIVLR